MGKTGPQSMMKINWPIKRSKNSTHLAINCIQLSVNYSIQYFSICDVMSVHDDVSNRSTLVTCSTPDNTLMFTSVCLIYINILLNITSYIKVLCRPCLLENRSAKKLSEL